MSSFRKSQSRNSYSNNNKYCSNNNTLRLLEGTVEGTVVIIESTTHRAMDREDTNTTNGRRRTLCRLRIPWGRPLAEDTNTLRTIHGVVAAGEGVEEEEEGDMTASTAIGTVSVLRIRGSSERTKWTAIESVVAMDSGTDIRTAITLRVQSMDPIQHSMANEVMVSGVMVNEVMAI